MTRDIKRSIITLTVMLLPVLCAGQAQIYTKKARLADFTQKTTKVVLTGNRLIDAVLRENVAACWHLSPYDFCSAQEYDKLKTDTGFYFLRFTEDGGLMFLRLDKGGKPDESNTLKRPMDVVEVPVASAEVRSAEELEYLSAFLDIIQLYTDEAMSSDNKAYSGLAPSAASLKGKEIKTDPAECIRSFRACEPGVAVGVVVAPRSQTKGSVCYKMLITCDTHELCYFRKHEIKRGKKAGFLPSELKKINGIAAR